MTIKVRARTAEGSQGQLAPYLPLASSPHTSHFSLKNYQKNSIKSTKQRKAGEAEWLPRLFAPCGAARAPSWGAPKSGIKI